SGHECCGPRTPSLPLQSGDTIHANLLVVKDGSTGGQFMVSVCNGSDGSITNLNMKNTDTIGTLQQKFLKLKPALRNSMNLALNGKPVPVQKTLGELNVKSGSKFIIFQRCPGG
uniref:Ubiquitin-like domain-containing protein n=1 Tax=Denticeps clupeoides TaxID=299321 RepID=A0AAY4AA98_9TELE